MTELGSLIERLGYVMAVLGGIALAAIFAIVLINGAWPDFLRPVQPLFAIIEQFLGSLVFVAELVIFVGPGILLALIGRRLGGEFPGES